jgi:hypothetical protein
MPSQQRVPAQNVALVPQQCPPHSMALPAQATGWQPSVVLPPPAKNNRSGHVIGEPQTVLTSVLHSFSAWPRLQPSCWHCAPSDPGALQNTTCEQLVAAAIASPPGGALAVASPAVLFDTAVGSPGFAVLGSLLCTSVAG